MVKAKKVCKWNRDRMDRNRKELQELKELDELDSLRERTSAVEKADITILRAEEERRKPENAFTSEYVDLLTAQICDLEEKINALAYTDKNYLREEKVEVLYEKELLQHTTIAKLKEFLKTKQREEFWMRGRGYINCTGNKDKLVGRVKKILKDIEQHKWAAGKRTLPTNRYAKKRRRPACIPGTLTNPSSARSSLCSNV